MADQNKASPDDVNPEDFLRALMKISPEDAEKAREQSPATRPRREKKRGNDPSVADGAD